VSERGGGDHLDLDALARRAVPRKPVFRLKVVPITIPPLRERREDIPELARFFAMRAAQENGVPYKPLAEDVVQRLKQGEWRGNVRELENTIERAVILSRGDQIGLEDIWMPLDRPATPHDPCAPAERLNRSSAPEFSMR
jgi:DNA-binding NtrC family response regulator